MFTHHIKIPINDTVSPCIHWEKDMRWRGGKYAESWRDVDAINPYTHTHCSSDRHLDGYLVTSSQWDTSKHPSSLFSIHSTSSILHHLSPTTCLFVLLPLTQIFYLPLSLHPSIVMLSLSLSLAISYSVFQRWHFKGSVSETDDVSHCTFITYEIAKLKCSSTLSLPFLKSVMNHPYEAQMSFGPFSVSSSVQIYYRPHSVYICVCTGTRLVKHTWSW